MLMHFPGFPEEFSERIEFPSEFELLKQVLFANAPIDFFMRHATAFQKSIVDKVPFRNTTKNIYVSCVVRYVYPGILINKIVLPHLGSTRNEWHPDGVGDPHRVVHAITNHLGTEFNINPFSLELPDHPDDNKVIETMYHKQDELNIQPKASETHRIVTYTNHVHRAPLATESGVRFFLRFQETNANFNTPRELWISKGTDVFRGTEVVPNLRQEYGMIRLYY